MGSSNNQILSIRYLRIIKIWGLVVLAPHIKIGQKMLHQDIGYYVKDSSDTHCA